MRKPNLVRWAEPRSGDPLSFDQWLSFFQFGGIGYPLSLNQTLTGDLEVINSNFASYVAQAYKADGIVFSCMLCRQMLFSEARFQFRRLRSGRPGEYFGTSQLAVLEKPWVNGTTGDLLARAIQDVDIGGNFFAYRASLQSDTIVRMRPDWVTIVLGSMDPNVAAEAGDLNAEVIGYIYQPGGPASGRERVHLFREQVMHWAPIPDPVASYRGMSWLDPILKEIVADQAATTHKLKFFENGATPNMVISLDASIDKDAFEEWVEVMESEHAGLLNAYKTYYLGAGSTAQVVGANLQQLDFKNTQGAGETRICMAARVPPVIAGASEGLAAATYSNYGQARRHFADGTLRPLWRNFAASAANLIEIPPGAELWYDDRDIPFLQEDQKDAAEVQQMQSIALQALVTAGFDPQSAIDALIAGDLGRLAHTGLVSVQLLPPGTQTAPPTNGNGPPPLPQLPPPKQKSASAREQDQLVLWAREAGVELR